MRAAPKLFPGFSRDLGKCPFFRGTAAVLLSALIVLYLISRLGLGRAKAYSVAFPKIQAVLFFLLGL